MPKKMYQRMIDVDGTYTYVGESIAGTPTTTPAWRIKRVFENGQLVQISWGNGTSNFDKAWSNRLTYNYSVV